jgi:hypothetical protein
VPVLRPIVDQDVARLGIEALLGRAASERANVNDRMRLALNPERMHLFRDIIENGDLSPETGGRAGACKSNWHGYRSQGFLVFSRLRMRKQR